MGVLSQGLLLLKNKNVDTFYWVNVMVPAGIPSLFLQSIKFALLRKYHFLTLSACGSGGDESHLLPRWAGHSELANQHISLP